MKKIFILFFIFFILSCSEKNSNEKNELNKDIIDKETIFSFDVKNLKSGCSSSSEMVCIINTYIKCTLNPLLEECNKQKELLPSFVFMEDEGLKRPSLQSYKIIKLMPRNDGSIEVFTSSSCNGNWFGLCNGNIIYILENINSKWSIKDIYALEN
jgi:hypothetical protein